MRATRRAASTFGVVVLLSFIGAACAPQTWPAPADSGAAARSAAADWLRSQFAANDLIPSAFVPGADDLASTVAAAVSLLADDPDDVQADEAIAALAGRVDDLVFDGTADRPGALAMLIIAAEATGRDPHAFGGHDLVSRLEATQQATGADAGLFGSQFPTYDGIYRHGLSLAALAIAAPSSPTVATGVAWLEAQQCTDGSWMPYRADLGVECAFDGNLFVGPDTNSTALALIGLRASGAPVPANAGTWLASVRGADGGWSFFGDGPSDPDSTGLAMAGLRALGTTPDQAAYDRLIAFQFDGSAPASYQGAFWYPPFSGDPVPSMLATNDAVTGLTNGVWPAAVGQ